MHQKVYKYLLNQVPIEQLLQMAGLTTVLKYLRSAEELEKQFLQTWAAQMVRHQLQCAATSAACSGASGSFTSAVVEVPAGSDFRIPCANVESVAQLGEILGGGVETPS